MGLFVKMIVAFCVGVGVMAGVQSIGLVSLKQYLQSDTARMSFRLPESKPIPTFDARDIGALLYKPPPIDTSFAQRGATAAANRQIDLAIRAGQNVPRPPSLPPVPRR
jgi:hypothetical protein